MGPTRQRILAASVLTAALTAAAFAMFGENLDQGGTQASAPDASARTDSALQSAAYRQASIGGVPPKFDFVEHWSAPLYARGLAKGDFNGDGRDDLAVMGGAPDEEEVAARVYLYLQTGAGTFAAPEIVEVPRVVLGIEVAALGAGDLNEDGKDDLVVSTWTRGVGLLTMLSAPGGAHVWREDAWNQGLPSQGPPQLADQDGDGHLDVMLLMADRERDVHDPETSQLATWFGDGQGGFSRHAGIETSHYDANLVLGQLDGTGPRDLLSVGEGEVSPLVYRADGQGGWLAPVALPPLGHEGGLYYGRYTTGTVLDFDGDGRDDAVLSLSLQTPQVAVYLQQADGALSTQGLRFAGGGSAFDRPADLDGNGLVDLVQVDRQAVGGKFTYLLQDDYGFDYPVGQNSADPPGSDYAPSAVAIGDFTGDGTPDVAISSRRDGVRIWRGRLTPYAGPGGLPGAPMVLDAEADPDPLNGAALVTLAAPAADGGTPVTGYTVYASPGGGIDADAGNPALVHRMTGLVPGKQYSFRARASNAAGKGPTSPYAAALAMPGFNPEINLFTFGPTEEPDAGDTTILIWPSLSFPAPPGGTSFMLSTEDGTAHAGSDYVALPPTKFTIPAGEFDAGFVEITVHGDLEAEGNETFVVRASDPVGASLLGGQDTVTLWERDGEPLHFGAGIVQATEGGIGAKRIQVPLRLPAPAASDLLVHLATSAPWWPDANPATEGTDYTLPVSEVTIPAGESMVLVPLDIVGDTTRENGESVLLLASFTPFPVYGLPNPAVAIVSIGDDDPAPLLSLSPVVVQEGDEDFVVAHFKATLSGTQPDDAWFSFETLAGSATPGADFADTRRNGLVIRAGETELDIPVLVAGDRLSEGTEAFSARLASAFQVTLGSAVATGTILDNDAPTGISVNGVSQPEGNGPGLARFVVELAAPQDHPVVVDLHTTDGTAFAGSDYTAIAMQDVLIPAGQARLTVDVPVLGDTMPEASETFGLEITRAVGATPVRSRALARLVNDDLPAISISDASVVEGTGPDGTRTMVFTVSLSAPSAQPVNYWLKVVSQGSATPWSDMSANYLPAPIDPGRTRQLVELTVYADDIVEPDETFELVISAVHGATIGDGTGIGTIIDDDAPTVAATTTIPTKMRLVAPVAGAKARNQGPRAGTRTPDSRQ